MSMMPANAATLDPWWRDGRQVLRFALWGLASGCVTWVLIDLAHTVEVHPEYRLPLPRLGAGDGLAVMDLSVIPGLVFGGVIGLFLYRQRLATVLRVVLYAAAATVANFVATNLALIVEGGSNIEPLWMGFIAGFTGAACLTVLSLPILPFARRLRSCALMLAAGCLLGGLLQVALGSEDYGFLVLYAAWQAGYAAALGTAVPRK